MSESENFGLTKVLDGLRSVLNARHMTNLQSGQYINDYTSSVSNYSGIFDKNNSYKKFAIVYNTGDGTYYYARDDLTAGLGVSITEANRFSLEATAPTVPEAKHSPIGYYLFDENDPLNFYVYPGVAGNAYVEMVYSQRPTDLANTSATIAVPDNYSNALIDYCLFRAFTKDS